MNLLKIMDANVTHYINLSNYDVSIHPAKNKDFLEVEFINIHTGNNKEFNGQYFLTVTREEGNHLDKAMYEMCKTFTVLKPYFVMEGA